MAARRRRLMLVLLRACLWLQRWCEAEFVAGDLEGFHDVVLLQLKRIL